VSDYREIRIAVTCDSNGNMSASGYRGASTGLASHRQQTREESQAGLDDDTARVTHWVTLRLPVPTPITPVDIRIDSEPKP